jgi:adenylylsulfate kinase
MATLSNVEPGFVIWLTGLPASGKTSLAYAMQQQLAQHSIPCLVLDSDDLRAVLTPEPEYSEAERCWFYRVIVYLAAWLAMNHMNVLIAATGNRRIYRERARCAIKRFAEVYVFCPLVVCQQRDSKGIYARAYTGEADSVPGIGVAYEPPFAPEVVIDTTKSLPNEAAESAIRLLQLAKIIGGATYDNPYPTLARSPVPPL